MLPWRRGKPERSFKNKFWLRVFWILVFAGAGSGYSFYFKDEIFQWLLAPAGDRLSPFDGKPVYTSPLSMMGATISIVMKGGTLAAIPMIAYSVLSLLKPWLPVHFWRFLTAVTISAMVSYVLGIMFVYYVLLPVGLKFLLNFGSNVAVPLIDIGNYLDLVTALMSAMSFVFMIPTAMYILARARLLRYKHFRWGRLLSPLFATFLGIILTPTADGINFLLVSTPVMALYEVGMFAAWTVNPEEGNYLWFKTISKWAKAIWNRIFWVVSRPVAAYRWVRSTLMKHGIWW